MPLPTAYEDSDADDEYERSVVSAPLVTDSETSPTDSDPPSTENTPTFYGNIGDDKSPRTIITEWTSEECAEYVSSLGLSQYADAFLENEIVGEALVALNHDELKEMGITSVGHRLTLLKSVYDIKVKQDIPIDTDHYIPLSADAGMQDAVATQADIARIIQSMKMRDQRLLHAEQELRKVSEEYRKLREELLPIFRMAKDKSQPLPWPSAAAGAANDGHGHEQLGMNPIGQLPPGKSTGISRKRSDKKLVLGTASNNASPTHVPPSIQENKPYISENVNVDPSAAVLAATTHLSASVTGGAGGAGGAGGGGGSQPSASPVPPNIPSPTSPPFYKDSGAQSPVIPRSGPQLSTSSLSSNRPPPPPYAPHDELRLLPAGTYSHPPTSHPDSRSNVMPTPLVPRRHEASGGPTNVAAPPVAPTGSASTGDGMSTPPANNTTPFKSFKVSMEDPCHKVLPAALKKYNISANWKEYALYIVYGDEERCLELDEKPLILFKQLDREGRKPMFMLRKISPPPADAHLTGAGGGGNSGGGGGTGGGGAGNLAAGSLGGGGSAGQGGIGSQGGGVHHSGNVRGVAYQSGVTLPGGVL